MKIGFIDCLIFASICASFVYKIIGVDVPWQWGPFFRIVTIFLCLCAGIRLPKFQQKEVNIFLLFSIPILLVSLYSIIIMLINGSDSSFFSRLLSNFLQLYLSYAQILFIYLRYNKKGFKILVYCAVVESIFSIISGIIVYGIKPSIAYFIDPNLEPYGQGAALFTQHDMAFAMAFILFFYIFSKSRKTKIDWLAILFVLLVIYLADKRIEIPSILVLPFLYKLLKNRSKIFLSMFIKIFFIIVTAFSFIFLFAIYSGIIDQLIDKFQINTSGRTFLWDTTFSFTPFSFSYHGIGFRMASKVLFPYLSNYRNLGYTSEISLHNDILDTYVGVGFLGLFSWILIWAFIIPKKILKLFSTKTLIVYLVAIIYSFITYSTDNTMTYSIFQSLFMALIMHFFYEEKRDQK
ncbi:O-antigen ligase family protein [Lactococcus lactis]|nr:O-antigen ligase family protein [Lactococcus lactis]